MFLLRRIAITASAVFALLAGSVRGADGQSLPPAGPLAAGRTLLTPDSVATTSLQQAAADSLSRVARGFSIGVIDGAEIRSAPSLSAALAGKLPGVSVTQRSGVAGIGARVWLRGPSSQFINDPLLVVDGIRMVSTQTDGIQTGSFVSRLDDIDPETIERIEVLRGIAASTLFGPGASKGVVVVTTRRPTIGSPRWSAFMEAGGAVDPIAYPTNFTTPGARTSDGTPIENCPLVSEAEGICSPAAAPQLSNPLEDSSPFRTGWSNGGGVTVSGGTAGLSYLASVSHDRVNGVHESNRLRSTRASATIAASPLQDFDLSVTAAYGTAGRHFPNALGATLLQAGMARGDVAPDADGYDPLTLSLSRNAYDVQESSRATAGIRAAWRHRPWLMTLVTAGLDRVHRDDYSQLRSELFGGEPFVEGAFGGGKPDTRNASVETVVSYDLGSTLAARLSVGAHYASERDRGSHVEYSGERSNVDPRHVDLDGFAYSARWWNLENRTIGLAVQQHIAWRDRLFATGSLRVDDARHFASDVDRIISPAVDASWIIVRGGTPNARAAWVDEARLRAAWGSGGDLLIPSASRDPWADPVEHARETAERATELEFGADASFIGGRLTSEVTYYRSRVARGLVGGDTVLAHTGFIVEPLTNHGRVEVDGFEVAVAGYPIWTAAATWEVAATFSTQDQALNIPSNRSFIPTNRDPIGSLRGPTYSYVDANLDGLIAPSEVSIATESRLYGTIHPTREANLRSVVTVRGVSVSAAFIHQGGHRLLNDVEYRRCSRWSLNCQDVHDRDTPLDVQARTAADVAGGASDDIAVGFFERGDYTRLAEVSLGVPLGGRFAGVSGARSARLTLTGRNLATWTSFGGFDPELRTAGMSGFTQPLLRSLTARLDVSW